MKKILILIITLAQTRTYALGTTEGAKETSQNVVLLENLPNEEAPSLWQVQMTVGSKVLNNLKTSNKNYEFLTQLTIPELHKCQ